MTNEIPRHVAIIMDGNGRWAQQRGLPRVAGHKAGVEAVRGVVKASIEIGVPALTLYAFSQENWKRPESEVSVLMDLLDFFLNKEIRDLEKQGVRLRTIGRIEALPKRTLDKLRQGIEATKHNDRLVLNLALNYGARAEILDAVRGILRDAKENPSKFNELHAIDEAGFSERLSTHGLPDPDLLIRTSGEMRLSNFLLWQLSYSEIYITKKYWPDFDKKEYLKAIREYRKRERRFGSVRA